MNRRLLFPYTTLFRSEIGRSPARVSGLPSMEPPTPLNRIEIADEIFSEALELPLDQRTGFVRGRCSSDGALCESVLNLLSGYNRLGDFLQRPAVGSEPATAAFPPGEILGGRFRIVSLIGRGGMGEVYRADDSLSAQTVALKVLHPRMRGEESMAVRLRDEIDRKSVV